MSARVAARLEMTRQYSDYSDGLINNPEANRVFRAGSAGEDLNESDKALFSTLMHKCFWYFSAMHYQLSVHSLSEDEWHQSKFLMIRLSDRPGVRIWWNHFKNHYAPSFAEYMDNEIMDDR